MLVPNFTHRLFRHAPEFDAEHNNYRIAATTQYPWNGYRIDIVCGGQWFGRKIFIECDGHDFHERTKQQASRDRQKDRAAQLAGIPILRFTGSEIHRNVLGCCSQILDAGGKNEKHA